MSASGHHRFMSVSTKHIPEAPVNPASQYISPTFKSSIFGSSQDQPKPQVPLSRQRAQSPTFKSSVFGSAKEEAPSRVASKRVNYGIQGTGVLPTVDEWNPKRSDINNPDVYDRIELNALAKTKQKLEQEVRDFAGKRSRHNQEVKAEQKNIDQRFEAKIESKKPSNEDTKKYKEEVASRWDEVTDQVTKANNARKSLNKQLEKQVEEKNLQKRLETEAEKNDLRTGLQLKPRKEYDMEEYKNVLKRQTNEREQKKAQENQVREVERNERLKELNVRDLLAANIQENLLKKSRSVTLTDAEVRNLRDEQTPLATVADEAINRRKASRLDQQKSINGQLSFSRGNGEEKEKRSGLKTAIVWPNDNTPTPIRPSKTPSSATAGKTGSPILKADWEATFSEMVKKAKEKEEFGRGLKSQMEAKQKNKELEARKEKEAEKNATGLKLKTYRPKETVHQVAEVVKHQLNQKQEAQKSHQKTRAEDMRKSKESVAAMENILKKEYETYVQKKNEALNYYKKEIVVKEANKKHKGLMTIKLQN